jgi:hypothetical protein
MGDKLLLKLNIYGKPIANKYCEGKMKRTLKRGLKDLKSLRRKWKKSNHLCTMYAGACRLRSSLVLYRLAAAKVTVCYVVFVCKRQNDVSAPGIACSDDQVLVLELDKKTGVKHEGPAGDSVKVAFSAPS